MASLSDYKKKRHFNKTPEPGPEKKTSELGNIFVVQKHRATQLHYDFRLEADGVLKSWAVPKGPPMDPKVKRLAMQVEDHPVDYADFEGVIPEGEYGGGTVMVWDYGVYAPENTDNVSRALAEEAFHYYAKTDEQPYEIKGLARTLNDAYEFKRIPKPMTPEDVKGLFDIIKSGS